MKKIMLAALALLLLTASTEQPTTTIFIIGDCLRVRPSEGGVWLCNVTSPTLFA